MAKRVAAAGLVEGRWALPEGWRWERARDIAKIVGGSTPKNAANPANFSDDGTPWLTPADLSGYSKQTIGAGRRNLAAHVVNRAALLPKGTVLISSRAPVGYCAVASNPMVTNQGFRSLILADHLDPFFVRYYVLFSRKYLEDHASGTTFKELSGGTLGDLVFPVPPLDVQRRIVARIDELFAEIDDGEAALALARNDLATWRKALLKAAVTGELTAEWRARNKNSRDKRSKRFSEVVEIKSGFAFKSSEYGLGSVPLIRIADVVGDEVRVSSANARMPDYHLKESNSFLVEDGDILLTLSGSVGRSATYRSDAPALLNQRVCRIRCRNGSGLSPAYAQLFLSAMEHVIASMGYGGSQANVSPKQIADIPIFLPQEDEQLEVLQRVDDHIAERDLAAATRELTYASATLRQSILAAAFRGELA